MIDKKNDNRLYDIIAFLLLFYLFNISIISGSVPKIIEVVFNYLFPILSLFLMFLIFVIKKQKITIYKMIIFLITIFLCFLILFRNGNISHNSNITATIYNTLFLFIPFLICDDKKIINSIIKVMPIFFVEHIIGVFFEFLLPKLYLNAFINGYFANAPLYFRNYIISIYNSGFMAGFSSHYSTTGIYLSISLIYYFYKTITDEQKKKKNIIMLILSIIALMMTGKRAVFVFALFSCVFIYLFIFSNIKKLIKFIFLSIIMITSVFIMSFFIPAIHNTYERFTQGDIDSNFGNRSQLYEYAITYYKNNRLLGNGWSTFKYSFKTNIHSYDNSGMLYDCHNIYLQLLCETGITGFCTLTFLMIYIFKKTLFLLKQKKNELINEYNFLVFSGIYQLFFLLYGLTGNPLYDAQCYILYYVSISITLLYIFRMNKLKEGELREKSLYSNIS